MRKNVIDESEGQARDPKKQWLDRIAGILGTADVTTLKEVYYFVQGHAGRVF